MWARDRLEEARLARTGQCSAASSASVELGPPARPGWRVGRRFRRRCERGVAGWHCVGRWRRRYCWRWWRWWRWWLCWCCPCCWVGLDVAVGVNDDRPFAIRAAGVVIAWRRHSYKWSALVVRVDNSGILHQGVLPRDCAMMLNMILLLALGAGQVLSCLRLAESGVAVVLAMADPSSCRSFSRRLLRRQQPTVVLSYTGDRLVCTEGARHHLPRR